MCIQRIRTSNSHLILLSKNNAISFVSTNNPYFRTIKVFLFFYITQTDDSIAICLIKFNLFILGFPSINRKGMACLTFGHRFAPDVAYRHLSKVPTTSSPPPTCQLHRPPSVPSPVFLLFLNNTQTNSNIMISVALFSKGNWGKLAVW